MTYSLRIPPRELLTQMFAAAVDAARPEVCLPQWLPCAPIGKTVVVGAGKAAAAMAAALELHWTAPLTGLVVTRYGYEVPCSRIEVVSAAHPIPDSVSQAAATRILETVSMLSGDDLVICLMSGGGSSLMALPLPGISLEDKQQLNRVLLRSGASISEINCVRRHLSQVKGGRLAAACYPAQVVTLMVSDVPGDKMFDIASGPTIPDPTTRWDALAILERYQIKVGPGVRNALEDDRSESVKPGDRRLARSQAHLTATPQKSLVAAAQVAANWGVTPLILGDSIEGEAREVGTAMAGIAKQVVRHGQPVKSPCVLLSGGETSVTVKGSGCGGRNAEFLLSLGLGLSDVGNVHCLAADTDGVDGAAEIAGAYWAPDTLSRAGELGLDPRVFLAGNDAHNFFGALGDALITGPTRTNVNDFRAMLIVSEGQ